MVKMAGSFGTDPAVMQKAAQQVNQVSEEIGQELRSLMSNLEPVASSWKGQAASAFQQLMVRWQEDANKLTRRCRASPRCSTRRTRTTRRSRIRTRRRSAPSCRGSASRVARSHDPRPAAGRGFNLRGELRIMSNYGTGQVMVTFETIAQASQNVQRTY